jgi:hypothetical protein
MHSSALFAPLLLAQALWLLAPGLLAGLSLAGRKRIPGYLVVPVAALIGCVAGYAALWAFFADHLLGNAVVVVFAVVSLGSVVAIVWRRPLRAAMLSVDVGGPLLLLGLLTLLYCGITFSCTVPPSFGVNANCHLYGFTGDNLLPQIFADHVHHGDPRTLTWGWQGSDRPPLQSGAQLLQAPLLERRGWKLMSYQVLAVLLQSLWLPALWALGRGLRMGARAITLVATMCVCAGFFVFNTIFTWPKLLPAALLVLTFQLLLLERRSAWSWILGGLAAGAAMTAHSGVVFTLLPIGAALLLPRYRPSWSAAALGTLGALLLYAPWQAYQRLYDPPGDRLLKWHLGGVEDPDPRPLGTLLSDQYGSLSFGTILRYKWENFLQLLGGPTHGYRLFGNDFAGLLRYEEFRYLLIALGLFNLGWLALLTRRGRRRVASSVDAGRLRLMFAIAGAALLIWVLLMFGPGTTLLHQGSYATVLLLFVACGALLTTLPAWLVRTAVAVQVAYGVLVWVVDIWRPHHLHLGYVAITVAAAVALAVTLFVLPRWADSNSGVGLTSSDDTLPGREPAGEPAVQAGTAAVHLR